MGELSYFCQRATIGINNLKMKKIALIYWPKKGNVEASAQKIYEQFDESIIDIFTITSVDVEQLTQYGNIIIGGSTTGADNWGDTHKSRWIEFFEKLEEVNISGKKVAFFGLGDQVLYPDHFVDGMAHLKSEFVKFDVQFVGAWLTDGYEHTGSDSIEDGKFIGLALDEDQQPELTEERIKTWTGQLKSEFGL